MTNKLILFVLAIAGQGVMAKSPEPYNGGIALEKTADLARRSIPIDNGNPEILLALAARHGKAQGHFSGKAAEAVKKQFGKPVPIFIEAVRAEQPGCDKIRLTYKTSAEYAGIAPEKTLDVAVCPNRGRK